MEMMFGGFTLSSEMSDARPEVGPAGSIAAAVMKSILFCWGCVCGEVKERNNVGC